MEITPRVVSKYIHEPSRKDTGHGTSYTYSRTINGTPYSFTFVLMPDGERRHFVQKYNGYCAEFVANGDMTLASILRFGCAWSPVHSIIVKRRKKHKCGCEHTDHFNDEFGPQTKHDYQAATSESKAHPWVGPICNDCAATCLSGYELIDA